MSKSSRSISSSISIAHPSVSLATSFICRPKETPSPKSSSQTSRASISAERENEFNKEDKVGVIDTSKRFDYFVDHCLMHNIRRFIERAQPKPTVIKSNSKSNMFARTAQLILEPSVSSSVNPIKSVSNTIPSVQEMIGIREHLVKSFEDMKSKIRVESRNFDVAIDDMPAHLRSLTDGYLAAIRADLIKKAGAFDRMTCAQKVLAKHAIDQCVELIDRRLELSNEAKKIISISPPAA